MAGPEKLGQGGSAERERSLRLLGKISIMRHGETRYTNVYPDITEIGQQQIAANAQKIKAGKTPEEQLILISSPSIRALGSAGVLKPELEVEDIHISKKIKSTTAKDWHKADAAFTELTGIKTEDDIDFRNWDRFVAHHPALNERIDLWEPRSRVEQRSLRGLKYVIEFFRRYKLANPDKLPHLVGVSHIEFLNHFVEKIFRIPENNPLQFGEMVEMTILEGEETRHIPIAITFRGATKKILFDARMRSIEILEENR